MALSKTNKNYNTFVKGIVTEANPLTYPENASIDESNFVLNVDGSRQRRKGIDFESGWQKQYSGASLAIEDGIISTYLWESVDNDGLLNFAVVQVDSTLYFLKITSSAISASLAPFSVDLSAYKIAGAAIRDYGVRVASGLGSLYVVSQAMDPIRIDYFRESDTISVTSLNLQIRDFDGVEDGLELTERPTTLSTDHQYNLHNQGWSDQLITEFFDTTEVYPSNADIWSLGKDDATGAFEPALILKWNTDNYRAPNGRFIIDALEHDERPSEVFFFAGRVFFTGVRVSRDESDIKKKSNIYFSRIIKREEDVDQAYQRNDPTSDRISDLLPDDGGIINIPDAGNILRLQSLGNYLLVFADNGVWQITGENGVDAGFVADAYQVRKVNNIGTINADSVLEADGVVTYWASSGIRAITIDPSTVVVSDKSITATTIDTLYGEIPAVAKRYARAVYDSFDKKIYWMYNDSNTYDGATFINKYTKLLVLDLRLSAFYKYNIAELDQYTPFISGALSIPSLSGASVFADVYSGEVADKVVVGADQVVVDITSPYSSDSSVKFITFFPSDTTTTYYYTFSDFINDSFVDWYERDNEISGGSGADYLSYLITGQEIFQDSSRKKQIPYLICNFKRTEDGYEQDENGNLVLSNPSGCFIQSRWDFSDSPSSNKWSSKFQAYRLNRTYIPSGLTDSFDYGYEVVTTKNKLRGRGRAISLYIESEAGKDMHLLGWTLFATGSSEP